MASIIISGLNELTVLTSDDFFPVVDSGSLTTYRSSLITLNSWSLASGSVSSSLSTISASFAKSGSWSDRSGLANSASFLVYPNNSSASYGLNASSSSFANSSSYALSSSRAITSSFGINAGSASYATRSFLADTASYFNFTNAGGTPPFASASLSASWASQSLSASHAIRADTASLAFTALTASSINSIAMAPQFVKAFATCVFTASTPNSIVLGPTGSNWNNLAVFGYNVSSVVRTMAVPPKRTDVHGDSDDFYNGESNNRHWLVTFTSALPSTNYSVMGVGGGTSTAWSVFTMFPLAAKTTTQFTISRANSGESFDGGHDVSWFTFYVFSNP